MEKKRGRPSKEDQKRKDVLSKLEPLTPKWIAHVESGLNATRPCDFCSYIWSKDVEPIKMLNPNVKQDAEGKCIKCHGSLLVADIAQRNWAAEQLGDRIAPKPKAQEIKLKDETDLTEFEKELDGADSKLIDKLAKELNIAFDEGSNGTEE